MLPCVHSIWYLNFEEKKIVGLKRRKKETPVNLRVADQENVNFWWYSNASFFIANVTELNLNHLKCILIDN